MLLNQTRDFVRKNVRNSSKLGFKLYIVLSGPHSVRRAIARTISAQHLKMHDALRKRANIVLGLFSQNTRFWMSKCSLSDRPVLAQLVPEGFFIIQVNIRQGQVGAAILL